MGRLVNIAFQKIPKIIIKTIVGSKECFPRLNKSGTYPKKIAKGNHEEGIPQDDP